MPSLADLERLKEILLIYELPRQDLALFGVLCPLCGKTDRIRQVELPHQVKEYHDIPRDVAEFYTYIYSACINNEQVMAVCKFCNTPNNKDQKGMKAHWIVDP